MGKVCGPVKKPRTNRIHLFIQLSLMELQLRARCWRYKDNQDLWFWCLKSGATVLKSVGQESTDGVGDIQENYSVINSLVCYTAEWKYEGNWYDR